MSIDTNTTAELRQAALDHLWQHNRDWESAARDQEPLIFVAGNGIRVTDSDGQTWIDVNGGYSSVNIGYGRTEIAEAAFEQLKQIPYFPQGSANPPRSAWPPSWPNWPPGRSTASSRSAADRWPTKPL